jgi:hypothetical protein
VVLFYEWTCPDKLSFSALGDDCPKKILKKEQIFFCGKYSALIFAIPKRNRGVEREEEKGVKKGV